jgi:copper(I)-binding protein
LRVRTPHDDTALEKTAMEEMAMKRTSSAVGTVRRKRLAGLVLVGALAPAVLAACGDDDEGEATATTVATDDGGTADGGDAAAVEVSGAWSRNSPTMAETGAAYLTITSAADDRLVGASVDPSVAGTVEIHETVMAEDGMAEDGMAVDGMAEDEMAEDEMADMGGEMTMRPVDGIDLPAGEAVALEPGGLHIMLLDLAAPLEVGQTYELTLTFEQAGEQTVTVEVREDAP